MVFEIELLWVDPRQQELEMSKNIYVGNLSYQATEAELRQLFEQFGQVNSAKIITDRQTGRSRGFGFVEMEVEGEAKQEWL